jgi:hypothetical protein
VAFIFRMTWPRWTFTVVSLMPTSTAVRGQRQEGLRVGRADALVWAMSDLLVEPMPVLAASFVSSSERGRKPGPYSMPGSGALMKGGRFAADSTLEQRRFELSVPA